MIPLSLNAIGNHCRAYYDFKMKFLPNSAVRKARQGGLVNIIMLDNFQSVISPVYRGHLNISKTIIFSRLSVDTHTAAIQKPKY
jgi:hypothetical protein